MTSQEEQFCEHQDSYILYACLVCRGSDMKLKADAKAVLTLGANMCHDKLMQAAARLRQLEKQQHLVIAAPGDVHISISEVCGPAKAEHIEPRHIQQWVL